ncbi:hypothetical protein [Arthrobacter agilis]|uniref:hypothetical protein n=1 Tax=Arthrobacter agilis TaxID=37921 RepID=UPI002786EBB0|nr:hypothetical protein [Arthrobacter agilis]MDQ0734517.1 hypothetical protein [Arthrobacter agilis]
MTHHAGWLPVDLHIVSEQDLMLLQRGAVPPYRPGPGGRVYSSPWSDGLDRVLDELERRESATARPPTAHRWTY